MNHASWLEIATENETRGGNCDTSLCMSEALGL